MSHRRQWVSLPPFAVAMCVAAAGCVAAAAPPRSGPSPAQLVTLLQTSAAVETIAAAAAGQGLLRPGDPDIDDLALAATVLGITDVATLAARVQRVAGEASMLLAAFDARRRGSRSGDLAHWVAVALLGLDPGEPDVARFRAASDWEQGYVDDVLALRDLHARGQLTAPTAAPEPVPETYAIAVAPVLEAADRPRVQAVRDSDFWPVFATPGARTFGGTIALAAGEMLDWGALMITVRRPGSVLVREAPAQRLAAFRIGDDGQLRPDAPRALTAGAELQLLARFPGRFSLAIDATDVVVELPWGIGCCQLAGEPDADWWVRLESGSGAGAWVMVANESFRIIHPDRP